MTMLTLLPVPTCLRSHEKNAVRAELYEIVRDARIESADDERSLADRVRRGLEVKARLRFSSVPRSRALVSLR
jgi:hypothetical protein